MNRVDLIGNLCRDNDIRYSAGENASAILHNTIAVQRKFKDKSTGKYESDFISIVAFGNTAEFINKHFVKGSKLAVSGRIQTGSYINKDGQKVYTTEVVVEDAEFVTKKDENPANDAPAPTPKSDDFINQGLENDLPWE
jgi:single-strand DNA-binding protein